MAERTKAPRTGRRRRGLLLAAACIVACRAESPRDPSFSGRADHAWAPADGDRDGTPYNLAVQKSSHNAYARTEPIFDQLVWHGIRSLELDIHTDKARERAADGDWFVYHEDLPFFRESSCTMLSDCLGQLKAFHDAAPDHDVVTLWIDLKDGFRPGQAPGDLDALLAARLGRDNVVRPEDLRARCPGAADLRAAVTGKDASCTFPTLGELRGKFVVAVTGGSSCDPRSPVRAYEGDDAMTKTAFVAPDVDASCPTEAYATRPDVVFLNMPLSERARARAIAAQGLVSRIYGGGIFGSLDSLDDFSLARASGSVHLATDMINTLESAWATTFDGTRKMIALGREAGRSARERVELARGAVIEATGGGIGGTSDSFWFSYDDDPTDAVYRTFASVPSSHTDPRAKACLMARESDAPDAANVAICRSFSGLPLSLQVRRKTGEATTAAPLTDVGGVSVATPAFMRLGVRANGQGTDVVAEGSSDGVAWKTMARVTLDVTLPLRGLAVASHGTSPVRAIFGGLLRQAGAPRLAESWTSLEKAIGDGAAGRASAFRSGEET